MMQVDRSAVVAALDETADEVIADGPAATAVLDVALDAAAGREALIVRHMGLVRYVVRSMTRYAQASAIVDYDDLIGYGTEGLIHAIDTFDPTHHARFTTWAVMHIRTTIQDALRALDPLSRSLRQKSREIERASYELAHRRGAWPQDAEVAAELGIPVAKFRETLRDINVTLVSLEQGHDADESETGRSWLSALADDDPEVDPAATLDISETYMMLREAVDRLPGREALLVRGYYQQGRAMKSIAAELGVTDSRTSQIHARALKLLRDLLATAVHDTAAVVA